MQIAVNRPLPSSKTLTFKMRLGAQPFLWKWVFMKMKNYLHINGWAPTLVLKQRPGGTRKWPNINSKMTVSVSYFPRQVASVHINLRIFQVEKGLRKKYILTWKNVQFLQSELEVFYVVFVPIVCCDRQGPQYHYPLKAKKAIFDIFLLLQCVSNSLNWPIAADIFHSSALS